MGWVDIARADAKTRLRSPAVWTVVGLCFLSMLALGRVTARGSLLTGEALLGTNARTFGLVLTFLFAPVLGLVVGHGALSRADGNRNGNDGAGRTIEGADTPETSAAVFVGTVVGRVGVSSVALLVAFLPVFLVWFAQSGVAALYEMVVAFLVALALGLLFLAVAIAISTLTGSHTLAATGAAGALAGLYAWPFLPELVGVGVPHALLERFWLVFVAGDVSTALFALRRGEVTSSVLGFVVLGVLVAAPLALGYARFDPESGA